MGSDTPPPELTPPELTRSEGTRSPETRLLRRVGDRLRGVEPRFDARALSEIGFHAVGRGDEEAERFDARMVQVREVFLEAASDGPVQSDAEALLLDRLRASLDACLADLAEGEVAVVESQSGVDWPKTRERRKDVIVDGENRFHFHWRVEPPLRISIYRGREG